MPKACCKKRVAPIQAICKQLLARLVPARPPIRQAATNIGIGQVKSLEARSADVYRYMNFDQSAEFRELADTVTV